MGAKRMGICVLAVLMILWTAAGASPETDQRSGMATFCLNAEGMFDEPFAGWMEEFAQLAQLRYQYAEWADGEAGQLDVGFGGHHAFSVRARSEGGTLYVWSDLSDDLEVQLQEGEGFIALWTLRAARTLAYAPRDNFLGGYSLADRCRNMATEMYGAARLDEAEGDAYRAMALIMDTLSTGAERRGDDPTLTASAVRDEKSAFLPLRALPLAGDEEKSLPISWMGQALKNMVQAIANCGDYESAQAAEFDEAAEEEAKASPAAQ